MVVVRFHDQGAPGGGHGQGVHGADQGGSGDGQGELAEKLPADSRKESCGDEHGRQHDGDREYRPRGLVHGPPGGLLGFIPLGYPPLYILDHHDGIIHHDADRKHQAEKGQVIEAEAQQAHHREGAHEETGTSIMGRIVTFQSCRKAITTSSTRIIASNKV